LSKLKAAEKYSGSATVSFPAFLEICRKLHGKFRTDESHLLYTFIYLERIEKSSKIIGFTGTGESLAAPQTLPGNSPTTTGWLIP
jgi:hypothetical protein